MAASTALQVVVSPFLGVVYESLSSLIQKEIGLVLGVSKELEKLSNTLSTIRDVLEDVEVKQIDDKPINNWLRKLKDLVYEADDILDECATEALIPESDIVRNNSCNIQVTSPLDSSCFDLKGIMFRRSIGKRIKKLSEKFDEMAELRSKFHLNLTPKHAEHGRKEQRETSSTLTEPQVYGREEEKEHIANLLLKGGDEVSVCCIVGMGGLGKTTLAQLVYNDENITNHFQLKCWVCVSEDFVLKTLLKSIIESTGGNARDLEDLDPLERRVQGILSGKKFLLVLDDVWNEDQTKWYKLKSLLTCGGRGSSIIVTSRLESVALLTSTLPIRRLEILSAENCWSLFKHYAFNVENNEYHQKFEEIGKEIVKKCGGVPLAAKALGGLLCFKKTEVEWLFVRDSAFWDLSQDKEGDILPALRLSYNHLSSPLKQCFSYCSIFPKDYIMEKEQLIHLWMANGFVQPKGSMELEDIGNEIFNELLWRSFFQDAEKDRYNNIMNCKMHDLVHDLACSITMNECTIVEVYKDKNVFQPTTRHLLLDFGFSLSSSESLNLWLSKSQPLLRTFFQIRMSWRDYLIQGLSFTNLKCLRVLNLSHTEITTLHVSIGNLKHLRYLNLSYCWRIRSLPNESICNLRNLQVLKLEKCRGLQVLPENLRKMTNLRHLCLSGCNMLERMPVGMGNLSCLRTLNIFVVVPETGRGISALQGLDHLTGKLEIKGLEDVKSSKDAKNANLLRKKNLHALTLFWSEKNNGTNCTIEEEEKVASIGEGLQPHPNIRVLDLNYYNGLKFPSWMSHSCLPNLVEISLVGCRRCEHLPPLGRLAFLEILKISKMDHVKCIGDEFYGDHSPPPPPPQGSSLFPSLRKLEILEILNLEEWSWSSKEEEIIRVRRSGGELSIFPSLECLTLKGCPKLRTLPTTLFPSLRNLVISWLPQMTCLPDGLQQAAGTLEYLHIQYCSGLTSLPEWMDKFTSLEYLCIHNCNNLKVFPEEVLHLTSLESVTIRDCHPDLHRRYAKETGEDWHKIAYIPSISITKSTKWKIEHDGIGGGGGKRWMKCNMIPCFSSSSSSCTN